MLVLPDSAGGKLRRLGIATITDRVVQASLKLVLEPIFEADFLPSPSRARATSWACGPDAGQSAPNCATRRGRAAGAGNASSGASAAVHALAYATTGDVFAEEPACGYQPGSFHGDDDMATFLSAGSR